jgi:protein-disulfide isomerase
MTTDSMRKLALAVAIAGASACQASRPVQPGAAAEAKDSSAPVARIGTATITMGELDEQVGKDLARIERKYLEQRSQMLQGALDALLRQRAFEKAARAKGIGVDELLGQDIVARIAEPTDREVGTLYDVARSGGRELPPLDQVKPQLVAYLKKQRQDDLTSEYYGRLKKEYGIEVLLRPYEPPRVAVEAKGPARGPANAPVTIVEFADYECPYCVLAKKTVAEVVDSYPGKVRLVYRDYPLPNHSNAPKAAEAAHCAGDQGKFWEMHDLLFTGGSSLVVGGVKGHARALGLDRAEFDLCLDAGAKAQVVEANRKAGEDLGVQGTPAFFINGRVLAGAQPPEAFRAVIEQELNAR